MVSLKKKSFDLPTDGPEFESYSTESDSDESPKLYRHRKLTAERMKAKRYIKQGFLNMKQKTGSFQRWKKCYFRLQEKKKLCYAREPTAEIFTEVDIQNSSVAETSIKNVNNSFSIIMPYLTIILCGDTRREMEEWISALRNITLRNSNTDILDRLSDGHNWYSRAHSRPTLCNVCGELLPGVTSRGLSCEVCTYTVHKHCAVRAVDKCKWTSLETIGNKEKLNEYADPFAMAHQWMQLNISPGSKCFVCDKNCGGKKNPQDRKCLWCGLTVHSFCESSTTMRAKCSLGENHLSILPPTALAFSLKPGTLMEATRPPHGNPLLVFVNTRSGDNQGVKFLRKFKQLLNPAQVFDLSFGGPAPGLRLFQHLDLFRILVCGGDGSVGWVMTEIDKMNLIKKCQISVLPLGTGNDLSRVLRWGASFYDTNALPYSLKSLEGAKTEMLDRWSIMVQEEKDMAISRGCSNYSLSSQTESITTSEPTINAIASDIGKHLSRIMYSQENTEVISSARVLCGIVKNLVSTVGAASASEERKQPSQPDELSQKCSVLNDKLDQLLHTLNVEEEAVQKPAESGQLSSSGKPKVFIPRDALMSRANSLKKALRQIIGHTEKAVDEQNAQTVSNNDLAQSIVSAATTAVSDAQVPHIVTEDISQYEHHKSLSDIIESGNEYAGPYPERYSPRLLSRSSPQRSESTLDELKVESKATVHFPGTIIAKAFLKEKLNETYGPGSSMIYKALIANADTLCAAASPVPDNFVSVEGFTERCVMNNYFSVGMDAKVVLKFHLKREENPQQFRSRKLNLIHYGVLGGKELLQSSFKNLDQRVHIEVDGHKLHVPRLQGIVVLNIPSYMSGSNFWGSWKDDDGFTTPSFDDKIIEVVAIFSCSQMGVAKVFGGMPYYRMAQCRSVKITITDEAVPVQVDGEPWMQPPGVIKIVHKNRAQMLVRDAEFESTLKSWTDIQQEKHEKHCISEEENMKQMVFSLSALIKCIQVCVCHTLIHQRLLPLAENLENKLNRVFPGGKLAESASRFDLSELVSMGKFFEENVKEFMEMRVKDLRPPMSDELRERINEDAVKAREAIRRVIEIHGLGSHNDESDKNTLTKGKGFGLGRLRITKRPELPKANTAPVGGMIQFWRVSEVIEWLKSIGLGEYREVFTSFDIGGDRLLHLDKDQLKSMGVTKQEHRKKILRSIKSLCGGLPPSTAQQIDRTELGSRLKMKNMDIEKDFDSQ